MSVAFSGSNSEDSSLLSLPRDMVYEILNRTDFQTVNSFSRINKQGSILMKHYNDSRNRKSLLKTDSNFIDFTNNFPNIVEVYQCILKGIKEGLYQRFPVENGEAQETPTLVGSFVNGKAEGDFVCNGYYRTSRFTVIHSYHNDVLVEVVKKNAKNVPIRMKVSRTLENSKNTILDILYENPYLLQKS